MDTRMIESLLETSLRQFIKIGVEGNLATVEKSGLKLIFPLRSNDNEVDKRRISEQEIRFLFIRAIDNAKDFDGYYAVETPTVMKYRFKDTEPSATKEKNMKGYCSASIDVCLYNSKLERTNLIEFKAHSAPLKYIEKDILKLIKEGGSNYFVQVFKNSNKETLSAATNKYNLSISKVLSNNKCENNCSCLTFYICVQSRSLILKQTIALDTKLDIDDWEKIEVPLIEK